MKRHDDHGPRWFLMDDDEGPIVVTASATVPFVRGGAVLPAGPDDTYRKRVADALRLARMAVQAGIWRNSHETLQ